MSQRSTISDVSKPPFVIQTTGILIGGTCEECKHWGGSLLAGNENCCEGIDIRGNGTPKDFGCTLWEATEETCD